MTNSDMHPTRQQRSELRGFPSDEALRDLATMYLELCEKLYPARVATGDLPKHSEDEVREFIRLFTETWKAKKYVVPPATLNSWADYKLCIAYVRYSAANSNPRSLAQQLRNIMRWAASNGYLIPPMAVFADAAVSGRTKLRRGYGLARDAIERCGAYHCLCIDELGRAHRDMVDALELGRAIQYRKKRLVGATDYLDSDTPFWEQALQWSASQQELFVKSLSSKVMRGMLDSFQRGGVMGMQPLGFRIEKMRDAQGEVVIQRNRKLRTQVVIDEEMARLVRKIFELYAHEQLSPGAITKLLNSGAFNDEFPAAKRYWSTSTIQQMLANPKYRGEHTWNRTVTVINPDTQIIERSENPESVWLRIQREDLRIVSDELWEAARRRETLVSRDTASGRGKQQTRSEAYPIRPLLLYCGDCDYPLQAYRSGKYAAVCCRHGKEHRNGCGLHSSKTLRLIEECLVAKIRELFLEEVDYDRMLQEANAYVAAEAAKPPVDLTGLDREIKNLSARIAKVKDRIASADDGILDGLLDSVSSMTARLIELQRQRDEARQLHRQIDLIDKGAFRLLVDDLRELLYDDVRASADVLYKVCGKIHCWQGEKAGKGYKWVARLDIDPAPLLVEIARARDCPTTTTLEFLQGRSWTKLPPIEVSFEEIGAERRIAEKAKEMHAAGSSMAMIARALNADNATVKAALAVEDWEVVRYLPPRDMTYRRTLKTSKVEAIQAEVIRLYDEEGLSFEEIGRRLGASTATVQRSYHGHFKLRALKQAEAGEKLKPRMPKKLPQETHELIDERLRTRERNGGKGPSDRAIAREAGVSKWVVHNARKQMQSESGTVRRSSGGRSTQPKRHRRE